MQVDDVRVRGALPTCEPRFVLVEMMIELDEWGYRVPVTEEIHVHYGLDEYERKRRINQRLLL